MRFSYAESMTDPSFYAPLARAAEEAGYDSMVVPDSLCYPLRLGQHVPVQSRRQPRVPRGQALPGAVLADPGAGRGHHEASFRHLRAQAAGAPPGAGGQAGHLGRGADRRPARAGRGQQPVARGLRGARRALGGPRARGWTRRSPSSAGCPSGGYFEHHGEVFDFAPVKIAPVPAEPMPILIGGHGEAALRRAARDGDGWLHGGGDPADLPGLLARLGGLRRAGGHRRAGRSRCT